MPGTLHGLKMLLRKGGTSSALLSIALLVAIIASASSVANYMNLQAQTLSSLIGPGKTFIILAENATTITESKINPKTVEGLANISQIGQIAVQKIITVNLTTQTGQVSAQAIGIEKPGDLLKLRKARTNGAPAKNQSEANIGEILANILHIKVGDEIILTAKAGNIKIRVAGIFQSGTQTDSQIILLMETAEKLVGDNTPSIIEFTLKEGVNSTEVLNEIAENLPENLRLIQAQKPREFTQQIGMQSLNFLNQWFAVIYFAVIAASHVVASRLLAESKYEFAMLRALGANRKQLAKLIIAYTTIIATAGSILGIALGVAGAQTAATILRWIRPTVDITPFLNPEQAAQITLLTLASSLLGCIIPALRQSKIKYTDQPL